MIWFCLLAGAWAISGFVGTMYGAYCMDKYYGTGQIGMDVYFMATVGLGLGPIVFLIVGPDIKRYWRGETFAKEIEKKYRTRGGDPYRLLYGD